MDRSRAGFDRENVRRSRGSDLRRCGARTSREPWIERAGPSPREAVSREPRPPPPGINPVTPESLVEPPGRQSHVPIEVRCALVFVHWHARPTLEERKTEARATVVEFAAIRTRATARWGAARGASEPRSPRAAMTFCARVPLFFPFSCDRTDLDPPERRRPRDADRDRASFSSFARAARPRRTAADRSSRARVRPASTASTRTTSAWRTSSWTPSRRWTTRPRRRGRA